MNRYNVRYFNAKMTTQTEYHEHTFGGYDSLESAKEAANELWDHKVRYGGVWSVSVFDTAMPEGIPAQLVFGFR